VHVQTNCKYGFFLAGLINLKTSLQEGNFRTIMLVTYLFTYLITYLLTYSLICTCLHSCVLQVYLQEKFMRLTDDCMQYHAYIQEYTNICQNLLASLADAHY